MDEINTKFRNRLQDFVELMQIMDKTKCICWHKMKEPAAIHAADSLWLVE